MQTTEAVEIEGKTLHVIVSNGRAISMHRKRRPSRRQRFVSGEIMVPVWSGHKGLPQDKRFRDAITIAEWRHKGLV